MMWALLAVAMAAEGQVVGVLFDADGAPIADAEVHVGDRVTRTDVDGRFSSLTEVGTVVVRVVVDGASREAEPVQVVPGPATELLLAYDPSTTSLSAVVEQPSVPVVSEVVEAAPGQLEGRVVDDDGAPVSGAEVYVRGRTEEVTTDADGRFAIELPAGTWDLSVVASGFAAQSSPGVVVDPERPSSVVVTLAPSGLSLDAYTVRAPRIAGNAAELLDERRDGTAVADVIGAEQMARSGDSNAASALRRVTGLTLVGGKYVYVRGMGDRYSSTLLDGGLLPSPEPERRVVPLDMFPSAILDSVVVQKTYSPDLPGEFGGGVVKLRTRAIPAGPVLRLTLGSTWRGGTTARQGLRAAGGPGDLFGVDGGSRALPANVAAAAEDSPIREGDRFSSVGYDADEIEGFGESLSNRWTPDSALLPPGYSLQVSGGNRYEVAGRPIGLLAGFTWSNDWARDAYQQTWYRLEGDEVAPDSSYQFEEAENRVRMSGMLSVGAEPAPGHELRATTLMLRNSTNEARRFEGLLAEDATDIRVDRLRYVERMLIVQQLRGEHAFGEDGPQLSWRYAFARASRLEPDRRVTRYDLEPTTGIFALSRRDGDSNQRFFSNLGDITHDVAAHVTVPIPAARLKLKTGAAFVQRNRDVQSRRFTFLERGGFDSALLSQPPERLFTEEYIRQDGFRLQEVTQATDNYLASQQIIGGYAMVEAEPLPWLSLMGGARVESSTQNVRTFELFNPKGTPVDAALANVDVLPAASVTVAPMESMKVRMAYGRTVSRPEFRELSPAIFVDVVGGRQNYGNPDLVRALIDHADLRWEWFPEAGDVLALSGFYKQFKDPVESIVVIGADPALTYGNAGRARTLGVELELRKGMGFAHTALQDLYLGCNASFISSRIDLADVGGIQTSQERPLQGQSPWVVNAQLGYSDPDRGIDATLSYNATGPRIVEVGSFGLPDTYELPMHTLDAVVRVALPQGFDVRLAGRNLLDARQRIVIDGREVVSRRPGWTLGLRFGWSL